ncbi:Dynamin-1-like protein [Thelohanellus kitauei]|uniref:Dynamin-1-like protein n=1 Tax=Thelohanellus kitauei TaxID=669202 RepID=A0A0C2MH55_THEKT|nr:Dynamin-1-like protein [Thelohanellus kitauei]
MKNLIPIVNKIQQIFSTVGAESLELPQIVAVGTQSSGKSSVIESIIGHSFLPRGLGMVTRRPLILQLLSTGNEKENNSGINQTLYFIINQKFLDFDKIRDEITAETNRILADNKDICPEPIILKLFSPDLVNLTVVDLPGLTRIPIGSQPLDIEKRIEELTLSFVRNKNSLILAVIPANIDIATSEAMRISSIVDPSLDRTILCLTKLDLMDKGTNASDILSGKVIKSKLGIIGVVNRSQLDIENNKTIEQAYIDEANFFQQNYPLVAQHSGIRHLVKVLSKVVSIFTGFAESCPKMPAGSERAYSSAAYQKFILINLINKFASVYLDIVRGSSITMTTKELFGGSRIYYIYHEIFCKQLKTIDVLDGISSDDILTAMINCKGMKTNLFFPESAFEFLVKKQITKLEQPSLNCVYLVSEEMNKIISQSFDLIPEFSYYQNLKQQVSMVVKSILDDEIEPTRKMVYHHLLRSKIYLRQRLHISIQSIQTFRQKMNHSYLLKCSCVLRGIHSDGRKSSEQSCE